MHKKTKIIIGFLSTILFISGGIVLANSSYLNKSMQAINASKGSGQDEAVAQSKSPTFGKLSLPNGEYEGEIKNGLAHGQGTIYYPNGDKYIGSFLYGRESGKGMITQMVNGNPVTQEIEYPILTEVPKEPQDASHRVPVPNDGLYHVDRTRPAGIIVYSITFHEGFRAPGMKAVDIHIMARSNHNENELVQGRDEIVSITGSTGKTYSMIGTKRTAVNTNAMFDNYQEQEITQYQDVSADEQTFTSIVIRRDGKLVSIKPDKDTKFETTHP